MSARSGHHTGGDACRGRKPMRGGAPSRHGIGSAEGEQADFGRRACSPDNSSRGARKGRACFRSGACARSIDLRRSEQDKTVHALRCRFHADLDGPGRVDLEASAGLTRIAEIGGNVGGKMKDRIGSTERREGIANRPSLDPKTPSPFRLPPAPDRAQVR